MIKIIVKGSETQRSVAAGGARGSLLLEDILDPRNLAGLHLLGTIKLVHLLIILFDLLINSAMVSVPERLRRPLRLARAEASSLRYASFRTLLDHWHLDGSFWIRLVGYLLELIADEVIAVNGRILQWLLLLFSLLFDFGFRLEVRD